MWLYDGHHRAGILYVQFVAFQKQNQVLWQLMKKEKNKRKKRKLTYIFPPEISLQLPKMNWFKI